MCCSQEGDAAELFFIIFKTFFCYFFARNFAINIDGKAAKVYNVFIMGKYVML